MKYEAWAAHTPAIRGCKGKAVGEGPLRPRLATPLIAERVTNEYSGKKNWEIPKKDHQEFDVSAKRRIERFESFFQQGWLL